MDKQQLQVIKERLSKVPAGPWELDRCGIGQVGGPNIMWATANEDVYGEKEVIEFVLNAQQDMSALVAKVEMLQNDKTLLINALQSIYAICSVSEDVRQNIDLLNIDEIAFDILNKMEGLDEQSSS